MSRDILLVTISLFTWGIGEGMFFYFQPIYLRQLGADPIRIGFILGGYGLAATLAHVPVGYLADRIGRRPLMWFSWTLGLLAALIMAMADSLPGFVAGLLIYGLTYFVMAPMNSYVTAARGNWSVSRAITLISASFNLGGVIGPILGGIIGEQIGLRQTFLIAAVMFTVSTAIILFIRAQPVETPEPEQRRSKDLLQPHFLVYLGVVFLAIFTTYLPITLSQNYLEEQRSLNLGIIGVLISISGLGVSVLSMALGQLDARLGFLGAQASVGIFALVLWKGTGLPMYALGYFLMGGYKTTRSLASAQTRALVQASNMGLAYGLTETVASLATVLAPLLAGYLYTQNPVWIYSFSLGLIFLSILASVRFSPSPAQAPILTKIPIVEKNR